MVFSLLNHPFGSTPISRTPPVRGGWSIAHCIVCSPGGFTLWSSRGLRQRSLPWQRCASLQMPLVPWSKGPLRGQHPSRKPWNLHMAWRSLTWIYRHNRVYSLLCALDIFFCRLDVAGPVTWWTFQKECVLGSGSVQNYTDMHRHRPWWLVDFDDTQEWHTGDREPELVRSTDVEQALWGDSIFLELIQTTLKRQGFITKILQHFGGWSRIVVWTCPWYSNRTPIAIVLEEQKAVVLKLVSVLDGADKVHLGSKETQLNSVQNLCWLMSLWGFTIP